MSCITKTHHSQTGIQILTDTKGGIISIAANVAQNEYSVTVQKAELIQAQEMHGTGLLRTHRDQRDLLPWTVKTKIIKAGSLISTFFSKR